MDRVRFRGDLNNKDFREVASSAQKKPRSLSGPGFISGVNALHFGGKGDAARSCLGRQRSVRPFGSGALRQALLWLHQGHVIALVSVLDQPGSEYVRSLIR